VTGPQKGADVINVFDYLDSNSFTTLALAASPRYQNQIDWRLPAEYVINNFEQTVTAGGKTYQGFDIVAQPTSGPNGIAWEFTGQAVELMRFVDDLYSDNQFRDHRQLLHASDPAGAGGRPRSAMARAWSAARCREATPCLQ